MKIVREAINSESARVPTVYRYERDDSAVSQLCAGCEVQRESQ